MLARPRAERPTTAAAGLQAVGQSIRRRLREQVLGPNSSRSHLEAWLQQAAAQGSGKDFRVLDAGAGDAPYKHLFDHVSYESADFGAIDKPYSDLTYSCELSAIPTEGARYDLVVLTQVLEHIPDPVKILREMNRVLKPGGQLWASAPLFYVEHEVPFDFFRYTQFGWRHLASEAGFRVQDIQWLEGYLGTLSYQLGMAARVLPRRYLLTRIVFGLLARRYARRDVIAPDRSRGMPKNYRVVLREPAGVS